MTKLELFHEHLLLIAASFSKLLSVLETDIPFLSTKIETGQHNFDFLSEISMKSYLVVNLRLKNV